MRELEAHRSRACGDQRSSRACSDISAPVPAISGAAATPLPGIFGDTFELAQDGSDFDHGMGGFRVCVLPTSVCGRGSDVERTFVRPGGASGCPAVVLVAMS